MTTDIIFLTDDLFFSPRVVGIAQAAGHSIREAANTAAAAELAASESARLVIVDLDASGLDVAALVASLGSDTPPKVLAFGPHVQADKLDAAREAGCDLVVSRGQFSSDLSTLLETLLS